MYFIKCVPKVDIHFYYLRVAHLPQSYMNFGGNFSLKNITYTGGRLLRYYGRLSYITVLGGTSPIICCENTNSYIIMEDTPYNF